MSYKIPTENEWEDWKDDLDTSCAHKNFSGKSMDEAFDLFKESAISYQEDLMWMPKIPFQFYIQAYTKYLLSEQSLADSDAASCFLRLILFRLETDSDYIIEIIEIILPVAKHVADNQTFYDADIDIYGDFEKLYKNILTVYHSQKTT